MVTEKQSKNVGAERSSSGRLVVVVLLAIGVVAGVMAVTYWSQVLRFDEADRAEPWGSPGPADTSEHKQDAGSVAWDPNKARQELEVIQQALNDAIADKQQLSSLLGPARRLVERYPRYASARTLLAQGLMFEGQIGKAYEQLVRSLELDGQQPEVHILAGTLALQEDRLDRAEHHYSMAVGMDRSNSRYYLHLAQIYVRTKELDKARRTLLEALQADSSSHQAYASLADVYVQKNKLGLALDQIDRALKHVPQEDESTRVIYVRRKAQILRRDNKAEEALQVLLGLGAKQIDPHLLADIALCWGLLDRPKEAAGAYEAALKLKPLEMQFAVEAARWRIKAGDTALAREHVSLIRRVDPLTGALSELETALEK